MMTKGRLEAFSDGVIAIIITIMVLELKVPHDASWEGLYELLPIFLSYLLSFVFVGIYWVNHHHLVHTVKHLSAGIMWSNMSLLFFLSLIPFTTAWMGENHFAPNTVALYGILLNLCGISYYIMQQIIMRAHTESTEMTKALAKQKQKGLLSMICYSISVPLAFVHTGISGALFVFIAVLWLIPDKNIERALR
jgi:uncharacterized membrane protein